MGIFHALGLGIFFFVLLSFMPTVFGELAKTLIVFLQSAQDVLAAAGVLASHTADIPLLPH